jgi:hypothetical protein
MLQISTLEGLDLGFFSWGLREKFKQLIKIRVSDFSRIPA